MANPDWYPIKLADRIAWHANYSFTAQAAGTNYGLSADDLADIARDAATVPKVVAFTEAAQGGARFGIIAPASGPRADPSIRRAEARVGFSRVALRLKKGGYAVIVVDMRR